MDNYLSSLYDRPEFITFMRKRRLRSIVALIIATAFVSCLYFANNSALDIAKRLLLVGVLGLFFLLSLVSTMKAFLVKPSFGEGMIEDIHYKYRTVSRSDELEKREMKRYLVAYTGGKIWCKHTSAYTKSGADDFKEGDRVLWFSFGRGESYIIRC